MYRPRSQARASIGKTTSLAFSRILAGCYSMVYRTINSDQLCETRSLILEIPRF